VRGFSLLSAYQKPAQKMWWINSILPLIWHALDAIFVFVTPSPSPCGATSPRVRGSNYFFDMPKGALAGAPLIISSSFYNNFVEIRANMC
jgi:hypothetical protein